jgi:RHS repeat-associated protein
LTLPRPPRERRSYIHDLDDHIIAETDASGNTLREYVWLGDTPLAVVDNVATSPAIFYVLTDHLMRPLRMTDGSGALAWSVAYEPFGAVASVNAVSSSLDLHFPGQWFQLESGLHYNWHRHYDASTGRYVQPDPLLMDDDSAKVAGLPVDFSGTFARVKANDADSVATGAGWVQPVYGLSSTPARALHPDGPSVYGYSKQIPLTSTDQSGLQAGLLACPFGGVANPLCDIGLAQTVITGISIGIGICEMALRETGQSNYMVVEAKSQPRDPCDYLRDEYIKARLSGDTKRANDIVTAQKVLGCRNIQKRR